MLTILKRGFRDTFHVLGGWGWLIGLAITGLIAALYGWLSLEGRSLSDEIWEWVIVAVGAGLTSFVIMLIVNICAAPYRLEKEAHRAAREENARLEATVAEMAMANEAFQATAEQDTTSAEAIEAKLYFPPPGRTKLMIEWRVPKQLDSATIVLDVITRAKKGTQRLVVERDVSITTNATMKTEIAHLDSSNAWCWSFGKNGIVWEGTLRCRFSIIASDGEELYWLFTVPERTHKESLMAVGQNMLSVEAFN